MTDTEAPALIPLREPADGIPPVLTTAAELSAAAAAMAAGTGPVAVDAERASGFRYGQAAYLVQLRRAGAGTLLIDPRELPDLSELNEALDGVEWVLHAASQDLACLAEVNLVPATLFDTELAGRLLGLERVGLGPMVAALLGLQLAKEHSAADWSTRPLPEDWLRYAALDVEVLVELRDLLAVRLEENGKLDWAHQEFEAERTAPPPPPRVDPWRRTNGMHTLRDQRALAIVRELWQARDEAARAADISPGRVLPDNAIVAAASARTADLSTLREFRARGAARRLRTWTEAVNRALALPTSALPPRRAPGIAGSIPPPRAWKDREPDAAARLDAVKFVVRTRAEDLHLPQENLLTPDFQRRIAWAPPAPLTRDAVEETLSEWGARPWQLEQVGDPLTRALLHPEDVPAPPPIARGDAPADA